MDTIQIIFVVAMVVILVGAGVFAWKVDNSGGKKDSEEEKDK